MTDLSWFHPVDDRERRKWQHICAQTLKVAQTCFQRGRDFELTVDDGRHVQGYRHVITIGSQD